MTRARSNKSAYTKRTGKRWTPNVQYDLASMAKETLPNGAPQYYFTMHDAPRIGLNPKYVYETTPVGVYAYPLDEERYTELLEDQLPYVSRAQYVTLLKAVQPDNMLVLSRGERRTAWLNDDKWHIKSIFKNVADEPDRYAKVQHEWGSPVQLTASLLRQEVSAVVDLGTGTIHKNEPWQAVFLTPQSFQVVETFETWHVRHADRTTLSCTLSRLREVLQSLAFEIKGLAALEISRGGWFEQSPQDAPIITDSRHLTVCLHTAVNGIGLARLLRGHGIPVFLVDVPGEHGTKLVIRTEDSGFVGTGVPTKLIRSMRGGVKIADVLSRDDLVSTYKLSQEELEELRSGIASYALFPDVGTRQIRVTPINVSRYETPPYAAMGTIFIRAFQKENPTPKKLLMFEYACEEKIQATREL